MFSSADIDANLDWARQHFVDHVRAGGSLPRYRAGKQPYGILPVTALDLWGAVAEEGAGLEGTTEPWRSSGVCRTTGRPKAARRRGSAITQNPDIDFNDVFAMDGLSHRYSLRNVFGLFYAQELLQFLDQPVGGVPSTNAWLRMQRSMALAALSQIGGLSNVMPRAAATLCEPVAVRSRPGVGPGRVEREVDVQLHRSSAEGT